jgi:threonine dehydrogenase-like Zn-dependent dehydrogenase
MLNVAIVGLGNIGNTHAGVYTAKLKDDVKLVAVCDIIKERADKAAEKYGTKAFYSIDEMLKSGVKLDAVSVATAGKETAGIITSRRCSCSAPASRSWAKSPSPTRSLRRRRWWRWRRRRSSPMA